MNNSALYSDSHSEFGLATQLSAPLKSMEMVAPQHFLAVIDAPLIARSVRAGQFIHVLPRSEFQIGPLLRRAFSVMAARPNKGEIDVLFRVMGSGTAQISQTRCGDLFDVIGPLGRPFDVELFHVKQLENKTAEAFDRSRPKVSPLLVGGGIGIPPLLFLAESLQKFGHRPEIFIGARRAAEIVGLEQLRQFQIEARVATDDGSVGTHGLVTHLLRERLTQEANAVIYACGPLPMLKAVAALAAEFELPCQVSLEENMPCGIGVCNGCVVPMKTAGTDSACKEKPGGESANYNRYQRICVIGPAIWSNQVDWEAL